MKTKIILTFITVILLSYSVFSQNKHTETVVIQTSAQCEMCKERIEKELVFTNGVKSVDLNLDDKSLTVTFKTKHLNSEKIREIVSNLGYDADNVEANNDAYLELPTCCKKPEDRNN